ncbi:uncharacterized protein LDX57_002580 [Aspergillus melleus]|uniref:uncharacterized protein n=1 Tax=Aspergillus melleus TaxID=138277 RepID=UPI001E8D0E48|nr:uncharacterized protein LDX57_002580 [Aspergillus melleus]KAH8424837.1 hypothetical protein LDX57_002580 [Aspergillus melleus]
MNMTRIALVVNQNVSDVTYSISQIGLFILEVNVGMVCAALPTLGPLIFRDRSGSGPGTCSSSGKINSFVRRRNANLSRTHPFSEIPTLVDTDDEAMPLRDVTAKGSDDARPSPRRPRPPGPHPQSPRADKNISVQTDFYVS